MTLPPLALALLLALPVAELLLFVVVASWIGFWWALLLAVLTTVLGVSLVLAQGREQLARVRASFRQGRFPGADLADTTVLAVAGLCLVVPGFLTDIAGFAMLAAPVRRALRRLAGWQFGRRTGVW